MKVMTDMFTEFTTHVHLSKDKPFTDIALNLVVSFTLVYNNWHSSFSGVLRLQGTYFTYL